MNSPFLIKQLVKRFVKNGGPGANVLIRRVHRELFGVEPDGQLFHEIASAFEQALLTAYGFSPFPTTTYSTPSAQTQPSPLPFNAILPSPGGVQRVRYELNSIDEDVDAYRLNFDH
jgi:hypothetical protein